MLAIRTSSARGSRSAGGTGWDQTARGAPIVSRLSAAIWLRITSVSISLMRCCAILRRTTRIVGVSASRIVPIRTAWPCSTSASFNA